MFLFPSRQVVTQLRMLFSGPEHLIEPDRPAKTHRWGGPGVSDSVRGTQQAID